MEKFRHSMAEFAGKTKSAVEKKIPIRPKSFEELLTVLEREGSNSLGARVEVFNKAVPSMGSSWAGGTADYIGRGFDTNFESVALSGRKISHREYYGYLPIDKGDPMEQAGLARALVNAEQRLQQVHERMSGLSSSLSGPDGEFSAEQREFLLGAEEDIPSFAELKVGRT
ncbi:hypothetical protein BH09PAT1_BH09PAT1_8270 [soil metagenome]